eukprot:gene9913-18517_t
MIQSQLKDKQKKLDKLDDTILGLISEEGEADDCVKEGKEAGQFRSKVQAAIIQIQGRLDDKLQRSVCYKHQITNSQFTIGHAFKDNGKIWKTKQMAVTHLYPEAEEQLLANQVVASVQTPQQPQRCCGLCGKPRRGHPRSGCMTEAED